MTASRLAIRELGLDDEYFGHLAPAHHDAIRSITGGSWLSLDVALAHYRAADALGLPSETQRAMGRNVAGRLQDSYAGAIIRSLRAANALTPRSGMTRFPTAWAWLVRGGDSRVYELGPKDLRVEFLGLPLAQIAYVREGWAGMFEGTLSLVARSVFVNELPRLRAPDRCAYAISWA